MNYLIKYYLQKKELILNKNLRHILTHGPKINFVMFADDCIIFSKTSQNVCTNINKFLQYFYAMSSQLENFHKFSVQISNNVQG